MGFLLRIKRFALPMLGIVLLSLVVAGVSVTVPNNSDKVSGLPILDLPRIPWEGGPEYWKVSNGAQFAKADAAGWDNPSYFPISVFLGKPTPEHVDSLKDAGINLYMGIEHDPVTFPLTNVTDAGIFAMPNLDGSTPSNSWTPAEVGNNPNAVSWFITDECDMGYSGCPGDQYQALAFQQNLVDQVSAYNDGRFLHSNFGNGILRTFWSTDTMDDHVDLMDSASADKYTYTSPDVAEIIDGVHDAPDWPNGVPVSRAYSYGWQVDQMKRFQNPANQKPIWTFIETLMPYLGEPTAREITPGEIEGAVWSALIHEARGIAYFQHNGFSSSSCVATYSIVDCPTVHNAVKAINAKVTSLAPVLNTQSYYNNTRVVNGVTYYYYGFNNGTDTMLKTYNGSAYIFAGLGMKCNNPTCTSGTADSPGSKTFTLPEGVYDTTVEVVGEGRTIPVNTGNMTFTDNFAAEYSHHVYKIALGSATDTDNDGASDTDEDASPHSGDANQDGTTDKTQPNIKSFSSSLTGKYVTLETNSSCSITQASVSDESTAKKDTTYEYPHGLMNFSLSCGTPGATATVTQLYHDTNLASAQLRKFNAGSGVYQTISGAQLQIVGGATKATYQIVDGGSLDEDGTANGTIVDPSGIGVLGATAPSGSLADTGMSFYNIVIVVGLGLFLSLFFTLRLAVRNR